MRTLYSLALLAVLTGVLCAGEPAPPVTVMAAASLADAFKEIGGLYEKQYGKARFSFGGSNTLRAQLEHGASADVFASANRKEIDLAVKAGLIDAGSVRIFARNRLAILLPRSNPAALRAPADLARPGIKLVLAADAVPVGRYSLEVLDKLAADPAQRAGEHFKQRVLANVVSREENVKSVVTKVRLGEADAGIAYVSDFSGEASKDLLQIEIPDAVNVIAEYPLAPLAKPLDAAGAAAFTALVLSDSGQAVLQRHGFLPAKKP